MTTATNGAGQNPTPPTHWERISTATYNDVVSPIFIGMKWGFTVLSFQIAAVFPIFMSIYYFADKTFEKIASEPDPYQGYSFYSGAVKAPIFEEAVCRVFIHEPISWFVEKIVPEKEISPGIGRFSCTMKISNLVSSIASGIIFGALHYQVIKTPTGMMVKVISCTVSGIFFGVLKDKYGLPASIAAHMTLNGTLLLPALIAKGIR